MTTRSWAPARSSTGVPNGPTWPNRMYLMTGMIDPEGTGGGPVTRGAGGEQTHQVLVLDDRVGLARRDQLAAGHPGSPGADSTASTRPQSSA